MEVLLLILTGLPAAGKSSVAASLRASSRDYATHVVSFDAVYEECIMAADASSAPASASASAAHGAPAHAPIRWDRDIWAASRVLAWSRVRTAITSAAHASRAPASPSRTLVIADDNLYYASMRRHARIIARECGAALLCAHIHCPVHVALARNAARAERARVGADVITRMHERFEAPDAADGECISIDGEAPVAEAVEILVRRLQDDATWRAIPAAPHPSSEAHVSAARAATAASTMHQADLILRSFVADAVRDVQATGGESTRTRMVAENANAARRRVMTDFRAQLLIMAAEEPGDNDCLSRDGLRNLLQQLFAAVAASP